MKDNYAVNGKLIGRGKSAKVYKLDRPPKEFVRKEFSPILSVKIWNWFFYQSPHPLTTETGHIYSYWKRRLAHRMCRCLGLNVTIPDAVHITDRGFTYEFVTNKRVSKAKRRFLYSNVKKLEEFFNYIGMPTWSFSRKNPFASSNFIFENDAIHVVDYEQSVPVRSHRGVIDYDRICFEDLNEYMSDNKSQILDKLGEGEVKNLNEALKMSQEYQKILDLRPKKINRIVKADKI